MTFAGSSLSDWKSAATDLDFNCQDGFLKYYTGLK